MKKIQTTLALLTVLTTGANAQNIQTYWACQAQCIAVDNIKKQMKSFGLMMAVSPNSDLEAFQLMHSACKMKQNRILGQGHGLSPYMALKISAKETSEYETENSNNHSISQAKSRTLFFLKRSDAVSTTLSSHSRHKEALGIDYVVEVSTFQDCKERQGTLPYVGDEDALP